MNDDEIQKALVIGAGNVGPGIALAQAIGGLDVDLVDHRDEALDLADRRIRMSLGRLVEARVVAEGTAPMVLSRIRRANDLREAAPRADIATEAIVEDPSAKRDLYLELDRWLRPGAILASNTSGLDVFTLLREVIPERLSHLIIHHYFLPAEIIPLVEVVVGPDTTSEVLEASLSLLKRLDRVPVVLRRFRPNFIVNSFQVALWSVTADLLAEGVSTPEEIDTAVKHSLGVRLPVVGVAQSLDFTGLDLLARILRNSSRDSGLFDELVAAGKLGAKSGQGLHDYGGRALEELEAERDRKYLANLTNLRSIGAFDRI